MEEVIIQFRVRFPSGINPNDRFEEFGAGLRQLIQDMPSLECTWSALGGMAAICGYIFRSDNSSDSLIIDRNRIADWMKQQPVECSCSFGDPEPEETYDLRRDLSELTFDVRNLSDEDRARAKHYSDSIIERIRLAGWKIED